MHRWRACNGSKPLLCTTTAAGPWAWNHCPSLRAAAPPPRPISILPASGYSYVVNSVPVSARDALIVPVIDKLRRVAAP